MIPILKPSVIRWECDKCNFRDITPRPSEPITRMHTCSGRGNLTAPMREEGTKCKVKEVEREDYVREEVVQYNEDNKKPIMAMVTTRDEGEDRAILAPAATTNLRERA